MPYVQVLGVQEGVQKERQNKVTFVSLHDSSMENGEIINVKDRETECVCM